MRKAISVFLGMSVACALATTFTAFNHTAASAVTLPCGATNHGGSVTDMNFGTDVPVILVHGVTGTPKDWTNAKKSSICDDINLVKGAHVALNFSYTGVDWKSTANRLRPLVNEIADQSAGNGGSGKVVIVGYSLGTVITRTLFSAGDISGKVGQVITIAAPNLNSWEEFPGNIVVRAIAGNIFEHTLWHGKLVKVKDTKSDTLIPKVDALKRFTDNPEIGGGRVVAECTKTYKLLPNGRSHKTSGKRQDACDHGNLLTNTVVTEGVVTGISAYVESLARCQTQPTPLPTLTPVPTSTWGTPTPTPTFGTPAPTTTWGTPTPTGGGIPTPTASCSN